MRRGGREPDDPAKRTRSSSRARSLSIRSTSSTEYSTSCSESGKPGEEEETDGTRNMLWVMERISKRETSPQTTKVCILSLQSSKPLIVGRQVTAGLVLVSESTRRISREHARITYDETLKTFSLVDNRSANGCLVNTERIKPGKPHPLKAGDVICFGSPKHIKPGSRISQSRVATLEFVYILRRSSEEELQRLGILDKALASSPHHTASVSTTLSSSSSYSKLKLPQGSSSSSSSSSSSMVVPKTVVLQSSLTAPPPMFGASSSGASALLAFKPPSLQSRVQEWLVGLEETLECQICMELMKQPILLPCSHAFCAQCWKNWVEEKSSKTGKGRSQTSECPSCRQRVSIKECKESIGFRDLIDKVTHGKDLVASLVKDTETEKKPVVLKSGSGISLLDAFNAAVRSKHAKRSIQMMKVILKRATNDTFGIETSTGVNKGNIRFPVILKVEPGSMAEREGLRIGDSVFLQDWSPPTLRSVEEILAKDLVLELLVLRESNQREQHKQQQNRHQVKQETTPNDKMPRLRMERVERSALRTQDRDDESLDERQSSDKRRKDGKSKKESKLRKEGKNKKSHKKDKDRGRDKDRERARSKRERDGKELTSSSLTHKRQRVAAEQSGDGNSLPSPQVVDLTI